MTLSSAEALAVACPVCDADIGDDCVFESKPAWATHILRMRAAREWAEGLALDPTGEIEDRARYGG